MNGNNPKSPAVAPEPADNIIENSAKPSVTSHQVNDPKLGLKKKKTSTRLSVVNEIKLRRIAEQTNRIKRKIVHYEKKIKMLEKSIKLLDKYDALSAFWKAEQLPN